MSESALKAAYEKVLTLPESEQAEAAELLDEFVEQRSAPYPLTEEQRAELRRRMADRSPGIPHDEVMERLRKRIGL